MAWWLWVLVGIALLVTEMLTSGSLFALFFGAGAIVTGVLSALGFGEVVQWIAFTAVSLVLVVTLRSELKRRIAQGKGTNVLELVGEEAILLEDVAAGATGRAELRGTFWSARIASGIPLKAGQRCKVERIEGLTLWLRAE